MLALLLRLFEDDEMLRVHWRAMVTGVRRASDMVNVDLW
jgi:hypothetical protein